MKLTLTTPDVKLFDNKEIDGVWVQTDAGPISILNHHATMVTSAQFGEMRIMAGTHTDTYTIRNAVIQMDNATNSLDIMALSVDETKELTTLNLQTYLQYLEKELSSKSLDPESLQYKFLKNEKIAVEKKVNQ